MVHTRLTEYNDAYTAGATVAATVELDCIVYQAGNFSFMPLYDADQAAMALQIKQVLTNFLENYGYEVSTDGYGCDYSIETINLMKTMRMFSL